MALLLSVVLFMGVSTAFYFVGLGPSACLSGQVGFGFPAPFYVSCEGGAPLAGGQAAGPSTTWDVVALAVDIAIWYTISFAVVGLWPSSPAPASIPEK